MKRHLLHHYAGKVAGTGEAHAYCGVTSASCLVVGADEWYEGDVCQRCLALRLAHHPLAGLRLDNVRIPSAEQLEEIELLFRATAATLEPVCSCEQHRQRLRSGDYDERAGGSLHCPQCGKRIGQFRQ